MTALVAAAVGAVALSAQTNEATHDPDPRFEIASVKPNRSATGMTVGIQGSGVRLIGVTTRNLLIRAYGVEAFDIVGAPDWLATERFDVIAKTPTTPATMPQVNAMLRTLLADRFRLMARVEQRDRRVYFLTMARDDGKLGPSIRPSSDDVCGSGPASTQRQPANDRCRLLVAAGSIEGTGQPLQALAATLGNIIGVPVEDMTFEPRRFDFTLTFAPERGSTGTDSTDAPSAPSVFTAVREQLGFKLESQRGPASVLVIDHIERPDPD